MDGQVTEIPAVEAYYDPYDFDIDDDPYPVWKRLRDESPLYRNERYGFYALSRYSDVSRELGNWETYRSGKGTTLDVIASGVEFPPGVLLFEDPPIHDVHRKLLSNVFTPRRVTAIEPMVREFCAHALDPLIGAGRLDFVGDLGVYIPMRTIGYLLGIPEEDQEQLREEVDASLNLAEGKPGEISSELFAAQMQQFAEYIEWRASHPSDDLMTDMLNAEVEEKDGTRRRLSRTEVLTYTSMIAGAGNETATRLIGFAGQLLSEHPDQRRAVAADPSLVSAMLEEVLRYEAPSPVQGRYVARDVEYYGHTVPAGSVMLLLNGSANRDERRYDEPDRFDIRRGAAHLSFGQGLHFCLGAALARLEARVALEEVLKRWPDWQVDYDNAVRAHTSSVRGWACLPVETE